ncbi:hypothetical protein BJ138DRAFT_779627 [Hygrophoropsis aurantiaca]|uniref:Uncharacterized protein n=1 Tax=Hygrophoropsis aurantiaca TaxID=72124 RepID=A0ACB7ZVY2_9AGAM|nr:hypothetical protein BJ138DRAFT_779627 [Hygrophoropsis aurantiaca]
MWGERICAGVRINSNDLYRVRTQHRSCCVSGVADYMITMAKLALASIILLGFAFSSNAQYGGGYDGEYDGYVWGTGRLAGIIVGAVVLLLLLVCCGLMRRRRWRFVNAGGNSSTNVFLTNIQSWQQYHPPPPGPPPGPPPSDQNYPSLAGLQQSNAYPPDLNQNPPPPYMKDGVSQPQAAHTVH